MGPGETRLPGLSLSLSATKHLIEEYRSLPGYRRIHAKSSAKARHVRCRGPRHFGIYDDFERRWKRRRNK